MTGKQDVDESDPEAAAPTAVPLHAVADYSERKPTTSSAHDRHHDTGPGQQIAREMARRWLAQADIKAGGRAERISAEQPEIVQLRAEIKRLREDNEVLKAATVLFAGELDPRNRPRLISS